MHLRDSKPTGKVGRCGGLYRILLGSILYNFLSFTGNTGKIPLDKVNWLW